MAEDRDDIELGRFDAGREKIVVRLREYKGKTYLDVRRWYDASDDDNEDWRPSKKGCMIPEELVPEVVAALAVGRDQLVTA